MAGPYKDKNGPAIPGVTTAAEPMPAGPPVVDQGIGGPQEDSQPPAHPLDSYGIPEQSSPTGPRVSMGDTGFGWAVGANDFHPNGFRPNQAMSTGVGKYHGSPIFAATIGMPDGVIASREQANVNKQKQLEAALSKLAPEFEDVDNPKYRDEFQRWGNGQISSLIRDTQQMYGKQRGTERLMTPGTPEYEKFRNTVESINTVARGANQANKQALTVLDGMDNKTLQDNPAVYKAAEDLVNKQGSKAGATAKELAESQNRFSANASLYDAMSKQKIPEMLKNATGVQDLVSLVNKGDARYMPGFRAYMNTAQEVTPEGLVNAITDDWAERYKKDLTREQVRAVVQGFIPDNFKEKMTAKQLRAPNSSGSGSQTNAAANYTVEDTIVPRSDQTYVTIGEDGKPITTTEPVNNKTKYPTISLFGSSNKQAKSAAPLTFRNGSEEYFGIPERAMYIGGRTYIYGKQTGMPRTAAQKAAVAKDLNMEMPDYDAIEPNSPKAEQAMQSFSKLFPMMVPMDENKALVEGMGYDPAKIEQELSSHAGHKEQQPFVEPTKDIPYKAPKKEDLPAGAVQADDGKWYVKEGDGWVLLSAQ